jgi:Phospholipid methyltransferase
MNKTLERQGWHSLAYVVIGAALLLAAWHLPGAHGRGRYGVSAFEWVVFSWILAGLHQGSIAAAWRLELHHGLVSAYLGKRGGFLVHRIVYVLTGGLRLLAVIPISLTTAHTLAVPPWVSIPLLAISMPFTVWGLWCALAYFGLDRAAGVDHFDPARRQGFEQRGLYNYIGNVMYTVVLLMLYHPGLVFQSALGLVVAAAHHAFVWVHYWCTEKPDLREIYGQR